MRCLLPIFLVLFAVQTVKSQSTSRYFFTHFAASSGLLSNQISTIVQDAEGFLWIGTTAGLQRYDGVRYRSFRHNPADSFSLPSNPIHQLVIDKKQNLWVVLKDGKAGIFDTRTFRFHTAKILPSTQSGPDANIMYLMPDSAGNVFAIVSNYALFRWNEKDNRFSDAHHFFGMDDGWQVLDIKQEPGTQRYWMSVHKIGMAVYDPRSKTLVYNGHNEALEPLVKLFKPENHHIALFLDNKRRLWSVSWTSLPIVYCHSLDTRKPYCAPLELNQLVRSYHEIYGFTQQRNGTVWVYGSQVLARFDEKMQQFSLVENDGNRESDIRYESIPAICEDSENNLWVGTGENGLYRFSPDEEYFLNVHHINRRSGKPGRGSFMSFMPTRQGTLLAGAWEDGFYQFSADMKPLPTGIKGIAEIQGPFAWNMFASADSNTIWIASQPGIYRLNQATRSTQYFNPPALNGRTIRQVIESRNGYLWLGMHGEGGLFKCTQPRNDKQFNTSVTKIPAVPNVTINKMMLDRYGLIWVGTSYNGVYVLNTENDSLVYHFGNKESGPFQLPEPGVSSVLDYSDSIVVITTATYMLKYNRVTRQLTPVGNPNNISGFICSMEKDRSGYVWMSTTNGLYRFNIKKKVFVYFTQADGIDNDNFILSASGKMPDGRLVFGSNNHFVVFNPESIVIPMQPPPLRITGISVMNVPQLVDSLLKQKEVSLDYKHNSLLVQLSPMRYMSPHLIKYRLEGLEKDWNRVGNDFQVVYSYLPPGHYRLLVKTVNAEGEETTEQVLLKIYIRAPFWKTSWFYGLIGLLVCLLLYIFDRERMKRKAAMLKMRTGIAGQLHEEVNTALGNINILSEMARIKADTEPQKSKEFIEQIHGKSRQMMVAMDDMLWSISPENDSMGKTVLRMQEYIETLNNRDGCRFDMLVDKKVNALRLDMQFRHEAYSLFKTTLDALADAGVCETRIYIGFDKNNLVYNIQFGNESCNMQQMTNLLQSQAMTARQEAVGASLQVEENMASSVILIRMPVK